MVQVRLNGAAKLIVRLLERNLFMLVTLLMNAGEQNGRDILRFPRREVSWEHAERTTVAKNLADGQGQFAQISYLNTPLRKKIMRPSSLSRCVTVGNWCGVAVGTSPDN